MRVGTKSLLFGAHQIILHPVLVVLAFRQLYGRAPSWRELVCIAVHDLGYLGCRAMDDSEGQMHPALGGRIARALFGEELGRWTEDHSRSFAALHEREPSALCWPDKLASAITPRWLYLALARASGELAEYRQNAASYHRRTGRGCPLSATDAEWFDWMEQYMRDQVERWRATGSWRSFRHQVGYQPQEVDA